MPQQALLQALLQVLLQAAAGKVDIAGCHFVLQLDDQYGSPSLDDVIDFTRALDAELERILGPDLGGMELEVSSAASQIGIPRSCVGTNGSLPSSRPAEHVRASPDMGSCQSTIAA